MRKQPNRSKKYNHKTNGGQPPEQILARLGLTRAQVSTKMLLSKMTQAQGGGK